MPCTTPWPIRTIRTVSSSSPYPHSLPLLFASVLWPNWTFKLYTRQPTASSTFLQSSGPYRWAKLAVFAWLPSWWPWALLYCRLGVLSPTSDQLQLELIMQLLPVRLVQQYFVVLQSHIHGPGSDRFHAPCCNPEAICRPQILPIHSTCMMFMSFLLTVGFQRSICGLPRLYAWPWKSWPPVPGSRQRACACPHPMERQLCGVETLTRASTTQLHLAQNFLHVFMVLLEILTVMSRELSCPITLK